MGGLSRKAFQIKQLRQKHKKNTLVVDAGNLFFAKAPDDDEAARETARGIARAMGEMKPDAIGVAPGDLWAGARFLRELAQANGLPLLSLNLVRRTDGQPLFPAYAIVTRNGLRVAILALTGKLDPAIQKQESLTIRPWQQTLPAVMTEIQDQADLVILLSSLSREENEAIARSSRDLHIIIQAGQGPANMIPVNLDNTLITQTTSRGKYLGILTIDWNDTRTWGEATPTRLRNEQNRLDRIKWRLGRMEKRYSPEELSNNARYQRLLAARKEAKQTIRRLKEEQERAHPPCTVASRFVALRSSLSLDRAVQAIVDATRRRVNEIHRKKRAARTGKSPLMTTLAGTGACGQCHEQQIRAYQKTGHARAFQTLVQRDQQYNGQCLPCHVTLPTYDLAAITEQGFLAGVTQALENVGCESCHGPSARHAADPERNRPPVARPGASVCQQCHTASRDKDFNFRQRLARIHCPAG